MERHEKQTGKKMNFTLQTGGEIKKEKETIKVHKCGTPPMAKKYEIGSRITCNECGQWFVLRKATNILGPRWVKLSKNYRGPRNKKAPIKEINVNDTQELVNFFRQNS